METDVIQMTPQHWAALLNTLFELALIIWALVFSWKMYKNISVMAESQKGQFELMKRWYATEREEAWERANRENK